MRCWTSFLFFPAQPHRSAATRAAASSRSCATRSFGRRWRSTCAAFRSNSNFKSNDQPSSSAIPFPTPSRSRFRCRRWRRTFSPPIRQTSCFRRWRRTTNSRRNSIGRISHDDKRALGSRSHWASLANVKLIFASIFTVGCGRRKVISSNNYKNQQVKAQRRQIVERLLVF